MAVLNTRELLLLSILKEHCLFLIRRQIQRVLTLPTNSTNKALLRLVSGKYLERRYRADTFEHFQTPLYYLGVLGWRVTGETPDTYKPYQEHVKERSGGDVDHSLAVNDVLLKFILESKVRRVIGGEDAFWQEAIGLENIPDAWIDFNGFQAFIEVDRGTEDRKVVVEKMEKYIKCNKSGSYKIMFPGCTFRVLIITTTEERIESLEQRTASDDIWFCTMGEFLREKIDHQHWFSLMGFYALPASEEKEVPQLR